MIPTVHPHVFFFPKVLRLERDAAAYPNPFLQSSRFVTKVSPSFWPIKKTRAQGEGKTRRKVGGDGGGCQTSRFGSLIYWVPNSATPNENNGDVDAALASFNHMLRRKPLPCIIQFNKLLSAIVKMRQYYEAVISLSKRMELAGLSPNTCTLNILINCFCQLQLVDLGFSVLAKVTKLGLQPTIVTFTTLINGLSKVGKFAHVVELLDDMVARGCQPDDYTYATIINGLCKIGETAAAARLFKKMEEAGCQLNVVTYSTLIHNLCKDRRVNDALDIFSYMKARESPLLFSPTPL